MPAWFEAQRLLEQWSSAPLDAHCHAHHSPAFREKLHSPMLRDAGFFCMTETPQEYRDFQDSSVWPANAVLGLGFHPWSVSTMSAERADQLELFTQLLPGAVLVGEIGLDFGSAHGNTSAEQVQTFEKIASACADMGGKILSIHAVKSAGTVLDILQATGALESNICIFHWFSGSQSELERAIHADCYFSVGQRMLQSKRGRAYVKRIPAQKLLYESDSFQAEPPQDVTISSDETVTHSVTVSSEEIVTS